MLRRSLVDNVRLLVLDHLLGLLLDLLLLNILVVDVVRALWLSNSLRIGHLLVNRWHLRRYFHVLVMIMYMHVSYLLYGLNVFFIGMSLSRVGMRLISDMAVPHNGNCEGHFLGRCFRFRSLLSQL